MADMRHDPDLIKKRIWAIVMQAQLNAQSHGGDNSTAAMDILCALALISVKSGAPIERIVTETNIAHAMKVVADFFPEARVN